MKLQEARQIKELIEELDRYENNTKNLLIKADKLKDKEFIIYRDNNFYNHFDLKKANVEGINFVKLYSEDCIVISKYFEEKYNEVLNKIESF